MDIYSEMSNTKVHLLNGGGIVSTDTLNSEAIINIEDYNSKSMGVL